MLTVLSPTRNTHFLLSQRIQQVNLGSINLSKRVLVFINALREFFPKFQALFILHVRDGIGFLKLLKIAMRDLDDHKNICNSTFVLYVCRFVIKMVSEIQIEFFLCLY